jgi:plasmid stabilization system protein ParE
MDLVRLHAFLAPMSRDVANRAIKAIQIGVKPLGRHPNMGRMVEGHPPEVRELVIPFGKGAYVVRYRIDGKHIVLASIRHGREDGF